MRVPAVAILALAAVPAYGQTTRTNPSAYATTPTISSGFSASPNAPCYSSTSPTSPCYSGTNSPNYSATAPNMPPAPSSAPSTVAAPQILGSATPEEARSQIEAKGFSDVSDLERDSNGVWRGNAVRDGKSVHIALDLLGNVVAK